MTATPHDGDLILKLYDLRREPVMRQARSDAFVKFQPASYEDVQAVLAAGHPLNTAYRMVSSYWEMAASMVKHGALNLDLFAENCGEGLALFAKVEPFLERLRREYSATSFANIEWVARNSKEAARRLEIARKRNAAIAKR